MLAAVLLAGPIVRLMPIKILPLLGLVALVEFILASHGYDIQAVKVFRKRLMPSSTEITLISVGYLARFMSFCVTR